MKITNLHLTEILKRFKEMSSNLATTMGIILLILLSSCHSETGKVEKLLGRLNAGEVNASSKYVWPEDYKQLYIFHQRFMANKSLVSLDYVDGEVIEEGGRIFVNASIKCNNCDSAIINYFIENNKYRDGFIKEKFHIKNAHDVSYVSLDWKWDESIFSENIKLCKDTAADTRLRAQPQNNSEVIKTIEKNSDFLIDENTENNHWGKAILFDEKGEAKTYYFPKKESNLKSDIGFFTIGWFGGLSILVLAIIAIVCFVIVFPLLLFGLFKAGAEGGAQAGCFMFILILIIIAVGYEFLENFLFEVFLINLPF